MSAMSYKTHIPALQDRGVIVIVGASKPAVEKKELLGIEEWEAGDYMFRRWMEERKDAISSK